jgi:pimeloyl-ACP methyl ester carboxylesterase
MKKVTSKDGTEIAYETKGTGKPVILVSGAMGYRALGFGQDLVNLLEPHFTVYDYDRRGRGESTDTQPFAVEREVEDIEALIQAAEGSVYIYGISSCACLALEAAISLGDRIRKLALFEPPYNSDSAQLSAWKDYQQRLAEFIKADKRGEAVELFMRFVGSPEEMIRGMHNSPAWPMFEAVAPTLEYDAAAMGKERNVPVSRAGKVKALTLLMDGGESAAGMPFMHQSTMALAKAIPHAQQCTLKGQTHAVQAEALAPVLVEFFNQP